MAFDFIQQSLQQRRAEGLLRSRTTISSASGPLIEVDGQHYLNFSTNDYLGMRRSQVVAQAWLDGLTEFGAGSGASPLVTGYTSAHQALENYLASKLKREKVLLFNSGFAANQAICQALFNQVNVQKDGAIIADKLMHASFIEGAQSSGIDFSRFNHNQVAHLKQLLVKQTSRKKHILVATESVFSMDGDRADLAQIQPLCAEHNAWLMLDDAHGFGVLGANGMGVVEEHCLSQEQVPIVMGTFGKAVGTAGAFVAGSHDFIDYLINFARHYIYSTAMPAAQAYATLQSLDSTSISENRQKLTAGIALFKTLASQAGLPLMPSDSAIQPLLVGDPVQAIQASEELKKLGIWVSAIRYPTVPKHTDRLRLTLSSNHNEADIKALIDALQLVLVKANT
ncbi:aminotransferase class I/II-fold pyridoxal phosphate-dependent enzyme [Paraglaciecola aestuariivivens]